MSWQNGWNWAVWVFSLVLVAFFACGTIFHERLFLASFEWWAHKRFHDVKSQIRGVL
jgi:hypothetical protein